MSTCTTCSTSGRSSGGNATPAGLIVVRFADDSVLGFEYEADAKRFWQICVRDRRYSHSRCIRKRHGSFGLGATQHSTGGTGQGKPETFTFLGFTMICGKNEWADSSSSGGRDVIDADHDTESEGRTAAQAAPADSEQGKWLDRCQGLLCIPRGADETIGAWWCSESYCSTLEACADAPQPACTTNLEADAEAHRRLAAKTTHSASLA